MLILPQDMDQQIEAGKIPLLNLLRDPGGRWKNRSFKSP